jgi:predicted acylesterase/phospholipase RssA
MDNQVNDIQELDLVDQDSQSQVTHPRSRCGTLEVSHTTPKLEILTWQSESTSSECDSSSEENTELHTAIKLLNEFETLPNPEYNNPSKDGRYRKGTTYYRDQQSYGFHHRIDKPIFDHLAEPIHSIYRPRVLVIGPGGIKGLKVLGFLAPLEDAGMLDCVDTYGGVSIGAVINLLIVAGYNIREIVGEAAILDMLKEIESFDITSIIKNRGLISNEPVRKRLTALLLKKFGTIPSLYQLYMQTGKALITTTLNVTDEQCVMMTPFSHPKMSCIDAVMFSMNIPFLFYQLIYEGKTYVDGALGNPYPIDFFDDGHTEILGIYMKTSYKNTKSTAKPAPKTIISSVSSNNPDPELEKLLPLNAYIHRTIYSMIDQRRNSIIKLSSDQCTHVCLESATVDTIGCVSSIEDKAIMLAEGANQGKEFIAQKQNGTYQGPSPPTVEAYQYPKYYLD